MTPYQRKVQRITHLVWFGMIAFFIVIAMTVFVSAPQAATDPSAPYRSTLIREAQAVHGLNAPVPMFAGQIRQESSWRPNVTAWDNGRGLAQFMDGTTKQVTALFPELGPPTPYDPRWAIRALVRYDGWIYRRVKGKDECHRWAAALTAYNAGLGWVQKAQRASGDPEIWFGVTEKVNVGQSAKNFEYSRRYPHLILFQHQKNYVSMGRVTCRVMT